MWETIYLHALSGEDAVVEWAAGSSLRPFLEPLQRGFATGSAAPMPRRCARTIRAGGDGTTLLPFRRLFMVAGV